MDFIKFEEKYNKSFSKLVLNEAVISGSISLEEVLNKKKVPDSKRIIANLKDIIEAKIYATIYYYALVQYRYMELSGNWTEAGMDRVRSAYIYLMLDIPLENEFSFEDSNKFEIKLKEEFTRYTINDLSKEQLKLIIDYPVITILDKTFSHDKTKEINKILQVVGSNRRIIMGATGENKSMIFGTATHVNYLKYDLYSFKKEDIRTPNCVYYIVAVIEDDQIAIREEVCNYIFLRKWLPVNDDNNFLMSFMSSSPDQSIAESIKKKAVACFLTEGKNNLKDNQEEFVSKMKENFAWHELSHDGLEDADINDTELAIVDGLTSVKENILSVLQEVMVEWYPEKDGLKGPMKNIADIAMKKDRNDANKLLFIYLSDAWFLDTDTEFMFPYTYIMFSLVQSFIDENGEVDYATMYSEIGNVYNFLADWYRQTLSDVYVKIKNITYMDKGHKKDFQHVEEDVKKMMDIYEKHIINQERDEKQRLGNFWINVFVQLQRRDQNALKEIFNFLDEREKNLYMSLKKRFFKEEDLNKDIKACVIDAMQEKGFILEV